MADQYVVKLVVTRLQGIKASGISSVLSYHPSSCTRSFAPLTPSSLFRALSLTFSEPTPLPKRAFPEEPEGIVLDLDRGGYLNPRLRRIDRLDLVSSLLLLLFSSFCSPSFVSFRSFPPFVRWSPELCSGVELVRSGVDATVQPLASCSVCANTTGFRKKRGDRVRRLWL